MLMDMFYENVDIKNKQRIHFNAFMMDVHSRKFVESDDYSSSVIMWSLDVYVFVNFFINITFIVLMLMRVLYFRYSSFQEQVTIEK